MTDAASPAVSKPAGGPDPLVGRVINDRFKIGALIARGGMGKVYRAEQAPLGRICALKVLTPNYTGEHDPEFHKRFFLEASIASKLTHPNTVTIFDYGRTDDEIYYMAMEYLEGHTLHRAVRAAGHFAEERTAHVARQVCRALREAHSLGVIHRDLKPANIFLVEHGDETDFVKVLDFGLVKNVSDVKGEELTQTGLFMGSPKYMAPEQIRGERVDARTDVYALGVIMYEMLTGKVPFDRSSSVNILMAHVNEDAPLMRVMNPNIAISPELEETVMRCMAKLADDRFRSMDEVLAALKRVGGAAQQGSYGTGGFGTGEYRSLSSSGSGPQSTANGGASGSIRDPRTVSQSGPGSISSPLAMPSDASSSGLPLGAAEAAKSGSKGMLFTAVLGALAAAAIGGYVALRPGQAVVPSSPGLQATTAALAGAGTPSATPAAPVTAKLRVNTEPDGAAVKEDGVELCSSTPCDIPYKGADADPAREHKLTLTRQGYRVETKSVKLGDTPVNVKLTRASEGPRYVAPQPRPDTPAVPTGYKTDLPY
jgi:eukaryotic-like serine/threonine-protein kinase